MPRSTSPSHAPVREIARVFVAALIASSWAYAQTGTLFVEGENVGIGTSTPTADLEIQDSDFAALRLSSTDATRTWAFSATPAGDFTVNLIGSGGQEFSVNRRADLDGKPTLRVQGSIQSWNIIYPSSRELKTDFGALDAQEVLDQLIAMPVLSWRYKNEDESTRHFGPVAEDFQAAYGLGDGRHISNVDAVGVTMAAIQGLYATVQEKDAEIEELQARLVQLESLVTLLTSK